MYFKSEEGLPWGWRGAGREHREGYEVRGPVPPSRGLVTWLCSVYTCDVYSALKVGNFCAMLLSSGEGLFSEELPLKHQLL